MTVNRSCILIADAYKICTCFGWSILEFAIGGNCHLTTVFVVEGIAAKLFVVNHASRLRLNVGSRKILSELF